MIYYFIGMGNTFFIQMQVIKIKDIVVIPSIQVKLTTYTVSVPYFHKL